MNNFTNISGFDEVLIAANNVTEGYLIMAFVVSVFCGLFLTNLRYGKQTALLFTSFVTGIILLLLNLFGVVQYWMIVLDGVFFAVALVLSIQHKRVI